MESSSMSSSAASNSETIASTDTLKRKSDDVGWEYGELVDPKSLDKVKCRLCNKQVSGGIFRLKQHVAHIKGNVASCTKSTPIDQAKCKQALEAVKKKKIYKRETIDELRAEVSINDNTTEYPDIEIDGVSRQPHSLGPMDTFARQISPTDSTIDTRRNKRQQALRLLVMHLAAYLLNPFYFYRDDQVQTDSNCMGAVLTCIEAFFPDDFEKQHLVSNTELFRYKAMEGIFARKLAILGRTNNDDAFNPVAWWSNYGSETPNLQMMAMKILSLTSSSSGCERNWSAFEGIHTKKRNRLDAERMSLLVYVQFNSKLANKNKKSKENSDFLLATDAIMAQEWIVEGGDDDDEEGELQCPTTSQTNIIRELDEDNFESEDEGENGEDFIFGSSDQEYW